MTFDYLPVASPLHDTAAVAALVERYRAPLASIGGHESEDDGGAVRRPFVVLVLTGGTEARILHAWRVRHDVAGSEPLVLVAHPSQNSLPAALEALARVEQEGGRGRIVYLDGDAGLAELAALVADLAVRVRLREARIGVLGAPSDWLVASMPPFDVVRRRWGPEVIPIDLDEVLARFGRAPGVAVPAAALVGAARAVREPDVGAVEDALSVVPLLRRVAADERLTAVTVRCFDLVTAQRTSGCLALADLNDEGIVAGCEGDLPSTIAMLWARAMFGSTTWMANPSRVDRAAGTVRLAHCTIARSLLDGFTLRSHFESGLGVGIQGDVAFREATLVRIGGRDLERLWLAEGVVVDEPHDESLCRTQLTLRIGTDRVDELLRHPLGNHLVVLPGHHAERLRAWWELVVA